MTGTLEPDAFLPWIARHARKLGLCHILVATSRSRIEMDVTGPADVIEMLAIGCSLGPIGVWVDTVERRVGSAERSGSHPAASGTGTVPVS